MNGKTNSVLNFVDLIQAIFLGMGIGYLQIPGNRVGHFGKHHICIRDISITYSLVQDDGNWRGESIKVRIKGMRAECTLHLP